MAERAPSSRGRDREVWVGLFVLMGLIAGIVLLYVMTEPAALRGRYHVSTQVQDAGGIRKGDPVRMVGVVIGRVVSFKMNSSKQVTIRLEIEGEYPIPAGSQVEVKTKSFFGEMVADIIPGAGPGPVEDGALLPGMLKVGLMEGGEGLSDKANEILTRAQTLLSEQTVKNVETSTVEMRSLLEELNKMAREQRGELSVLSKSLKRSAQGLESAATRPELEAAIKKTDLLMTRMDEVTASLKRSSTSLETVMDRLEKGEGSLGKLMKDDSLYKNLNEAAANASLLMEDIRKQPKRYVKLSFF